MEKKLLLKSNVPTFFTINSGKTPSGQTVRITIAPGINQMTQFQADLINKHPLSHIRFNNNDIEWLKNKDVEQNVPYETKNVSQEKEAIAEIVSLISLTVPAAKEIIVDTFDMGLLKSWLADEAETRKGVRSALEAQIESLTVKEKTEEPK